MVSELKKVLFSDEEQERLDELRKVQGLKFIVNYYQKDLPTKKFSLIERIVTKRKEYKKYKDAQKNVESAEKEFLSAIKSTNYTQEELYKLYGKKNLIEQAESLQDLGMNLAEVLKILEEKGISPELHSGDLKTENLRKEYKGLEDLVAVHLTNFPPQRF